MSRPADNHPPADWAAFHWKAPHHTFVPDDLFDVVMPHLTGAELKVLMYIMRRTFGFKKADDAISLEQFCNGLVTRQGRRLDWGTGLSKSTVSEALKSLREKNLIAATPGYVDPVRGILPTTYSLGIERVDSSPEWERGVRQGEQNSSVERTPLFGRVGQQDTADQQTVNKRQGGNDLWDAMLHELYAVLTPENYKKWLLPTTATLNGDGTLRLLAPDNFTRQWLDTRLRGKLEDALRRVGAEGMRLEIVAREGE